MADARITLTIHTDNQTIPAEYEAVLAAAAVEGFKVDGYTVTDAKLSNVREVFEVDDRVIVTGDTGRWEHEIEAGSVVTVLGVLDDGDTVAYPGGFDYGYSVGDDNGDVWDVAPSDIARVQA